jgi:DNA-binding transcriptional ArsR family regulator
MKKRKRKMEELVNIETGEVEVIGIIKEPRNANSVKVFTGQVLKDLKTGIDGAVYTLFWFIDQIQDIKPNQEPIVIANPEEIAEALGKSRRTINRHLKLLIEHDYIKQIMNRQFMYLVNPELIFKGILKQSFSEEKEDAKEKATRTAVFTVDAYISKKSNKT